jgi:hypothetical protein
MDTTTEQPACPFQPAHPSSHADGYLGSSPEIPLIRDGDHARIAGTAIRTGITPPFFRERAVYRLATGWNPDPPEWDYFHGRTCEPGYYVYDGGQFIESGAWQAAEIAEGRYPMIDPAPPGCYESP